MAMFMSPAGQLLDATKHAYLYSARSYKKQAFLSGTVYTITNNPGVNDFLTIDGTIYHPGDVIQFRGNFKHVKINNLNGTTNSPIVLQNYSGEVCRIGNTTWNAATQPAQALSMQNCHNFILQGTTNDMNSLIIDGDQSGSRSAYRDMELDTYTDNFEVRYLSVLHGGNGIFFKKDVDLPAAPNAANSWFGSGITLSNTQFHHIYMDGQLNEQMYIGHTAEWWDVTNTGTVASGTPYYGATVFDDTACNHLDGTQTTAQANQFKRPIYLVNVKVHSCVCVNGGADALQFAHVNGLEVYGNYVFNWATAQPPGSGDVGGINIGGGCYNVNVHDNISDNGGTVTPSRIGEPLQYNGAGGGTHNVSNNLFIGTPGSGTVCAFTPRACYSKGVLPGCVVVFSNNTVVYGVNAMRINQNYDWDIQRPSGVIPHPVQSNSNLLVESSDQPFGNGTRRFIYLENGNGTTQIVESSDATKDTVILASFVQTTDRTLTNYYQPSVSQGFRNNPGL